MATDLGDSSIALVAEAFSHAVDLLKATISSQDKDIKDLKEKASDFENRIPVLTETATQYKTIAFFATGGGGLGLIALIKTLISP